MCCSFLRILFIDIPAIDDEQLLDVIVGQGLGQRLGQDIARNDSNFLLFFLGHRIDQFWHFLQDIVVWVANNHRSLDHRSPDLEIFLALEQRDGDCAVLLVEDSI